MKYLIIVVGVVAALTAFGIYDSFRRERELRAKLKASFAGKMKNTMTEKRYALLGAFRDSLPKRSYDIDAITWNDLELDRVFKEVNRTHSSVGEEYLFAAMYRPESGAEELERREALAQLFSENEEVRLKTQMALSRMGKLKNVSLYSYVTSFDGVSPDPTIKHLLPMIGYLIGAGLGFVGYLTWGIFAILIAAGYSIVSYYLRKADIDPYLQAMTFVSRWVSSIYRMRREIRADKTILEPELDALRKQAAEFDAFRRGASFLGNVDAGGGDPMQMLLDYVRMLTHIDLLLFNRMLKILAAKKKELHLLFENTGRIDMALAIASYRAYRSGWCIPSLTQEKVPLEVKDLCHPMLKNAVPNSVTTDGCILLTGSNASGKSTFLKTIAVNALLAQSLHTVIGASYSGQYYRIFSSMALRDDLAANESYYIVEIRSLKRILDASEDDEPVLCFVDEVLRGTNTAERIAASSRILEYLAGRGILCFAATHDLELTEILKNSYTMYHFSETVTEDNLTFDYRLKEGKATSRNAIRLLRLFEYPQEIVDAADRDARAYIERL